ncbi:MAG: YraN family protein [Chloroflexi bacterium]|nr:YraN family protein [Chloroflexota bacterium]
MTQRQGLGKRGEQLARRHIEASGYLVLEANYRTRHGEIDLVAEKDGVLAFVEVRTRRGGSFGTPEESVTPEKQAHLVAAAQEYLQARQLEDREWRIDLVAVEMDSRGRLLRVEIIENAVEG